MKLHFSQIFQEFFHGGHEIQVPFLDERERQSVMDLPRVSTVLSVTSKRQSTEITHCVGDKLKWTCGFTT